MSAACFRGCSRGTAPEPEAPAIQTKNKVCVSAHACVVVYVYVVYVYVVYVSVVYLYASLTSDISGRS